MSITTTVPAPVEITRRRLAGLLAAVTAAAAAVTWTVATVAIDNHRPTRPRHHPLLAVRRPWQPTRPDPVPADATSSPTPGPIVVADAYHGAGFVVCPNGEQPVTVADAYHGTGTTVCP